MRLSSTIVFATFALLASAYPIDGYSQGSNSLWKRVTGNPATQAGSLSERNDESSEGPHLVPGRKYSFRGTEIQDYGDSESHVKFENGIKLIFHYTAENPWDRQDGVTGHTLQCSTQRYSACHHGTGGRSNDPSRHSPRPQHSHFTFTRYSGTSSVAKIKFRTYRDKNNVLMLSVLDEGDNWVMFYPRIQDSHVPFTAKEYFACTTYVHEFYGSRVQLEYQRFCNGVWFSSIHSISQ